MVMASPPVIPSVETETRLQLPDGTLLGPGDIPLAVDPGTTATDDGGDLRLGSEQPVQSKSADYTVQASDDGQVIRFTTASTLTLPADLPVGTLVHLIAADANGATVQAGAGATVTGGGTLDQNGEASCLVVTTDTWAVVGVPQ